MYNESTHFVWGSFRPSQTLSWSRLFMASFVSSQWIRSVCRSRFSRCGILAFLLYGLLVTSHRVWLPAFGDFLVLGERPVRSDLVVVAAASYSRVRYALQLVRTGYTDRLLIVGDTRIKMVPFGKTKLELAEQEAREEGISPDLLFIRHSTSTRHDARLAKQLMHEAGLRSATVVSDAYNMRRLAMVFDYVFRGEDMVLNYVHPTRDRDPFKSDRWWRFPDRFSYVVSEWIKFPVNFFLLPRGSS